MINKYKVSIQKLSKYHGESNENYKHGKIHEEQYNFLYDDYKQALDSYMERCVESTKHLSLPLSYYTMTHTIRLIDNTENNPSKCEEHLPLIVRQLTISNL